MMVTVWYIMGLAFKITEILTIKMLRHPISWKLNFIRVLLTSFIMLSLFTYLVQFIDLEFLNKYLVHNSGNEESNENFNPYEIDISSRYYGKSFAFDARYLFDLGLFAGVTKTTIFLGKAAPAPVKVGTIVATALSTGAVAIALRNSSYGRKQARQVKFTSNNETIVIEETSTPMVNKEVPSPQDQNNSSQDDSINTFIDSPNEQFTVYDTMYSMLMSVELLVGLALVGIIISAIIIYIKKYESNLQDKYQFAWLNFMVRYCKVAGSTLFYFSMVLAIVNLSWSMYFIMELMEIIKIIIDNN